MDEEDDDVKQERQRVVSGNGSATDAMRLVNLTKVKNTFIRVLTKKWREGRLERKTLEELELERCIYLLITSW